MFRDYPSSQYDLTNNLYRLLERCTPYREMADGQFRAACPCEHKQRTGKLSVKYNPEIILVHCHAGHSAEEIADAVGMTVSDLFLPANDMQAYRSITANEVQQWRLNEIQDRLALERIVLMAYNADVKAGREISEEDLRRVALAHRRIRRMGKFFV